MTAISDERAAELLKLCEEREKPLIVGYGMAVVFTADVRALLAAREEAKGLREALEKIVNAKQTTIEHSVHFAHEFPMRLMTIARQALTGDTNG